MLGHFCSAGASKSFIISNTSFHLFSFLLFQPSVIIKSAFEKKGSAANVDIQN